jgi:hypothetical protein
MKQFSRITLIVTMSLSLGSALCASGEQPTNNTLMNFIKAKYCPPQSSNSQDAKKSAPQKKAPVKKQTTNKK